MPQDELRFQYPLLALKFPDDETFASMENFKYEITLDLKKQFDKQTK